MLLPQRHSLYTVTRPICYSYLPASLMPLWQSGIRAKTARQELSESVVSRDRTRYADDDVLALLPHARSFTSWLQHARISNFLPLEATSREVPSQSHCLKQLNISYEAIDLWESILVSKDHLHSHMEITIFFFVYFIRL